MTSAGKWLHAGPDLCTGILGTCLCSLVQGGPNPMKRYNIFVILWAIYNSKITKTPEDIEQINITNNRVKNDKLFACLPPFFLYGNHSFFLPFFLTDAHTQNRHALAHTRGDAHRNLLSVLPREFINKIVSQL